MASGSNERVLFFQLDPPQFMFTIDA
jgi:hypothetical protein